ncbi:MAG TPA: sugar phosphate isomerase/epimerase [Devosia sp.]|uniref:sugar phosphate isomerase/epimerase family protein n=1 Tax=Devosia sp. TaxID=1871048 RepID=UPI002DDD6544|nr:sugar phosphate isomerase/epimerase [Devosia sp.]HEV2517183.1 sugar phosphate isomerase/epimerase [Devosia sp.]
MIGVFDSSLPGYQSLTPTQIMDNAVQLGTDGVLFGNILSVVPTLDATILGRYRQAAASRGLMLNVGVGSFNPARPARCKSLIEAGDGNMVKGLEKVLRSMPMLGARTVFFALGMIEDRTDPDVPWQSQLQGLIDAIVELAPAIRESGTRLLIKTHEEITSFEILRIINAVGSDLLGVAHDPVNVACRMEDPVECTRRIAQHVEQVHIDDCYLTFDGDLMRRYLTPLGTGDIDWKELLALVPNATRWIEFHRGQFAMPVFDKAWLAAQSEATLDEYRSLLSATVRRSRANAPVPDQNDVYARLAPSIAWLKASP